LLKTQWLIVNLLSKRFKIDQDSVSGARNERFSKRKRLAAPGTSLRLFRPRKNQLGGKGVCVLLCVCVSLAIRQGLIYVFIIQSSKNQTALPFD
jgi:hypothetical protein